MKEALIRFLTNHGSQPEYDTFLLAVSGGVDSMVLAELFLEGRLRFAIAHVNHGLRGQESDLDEEFVRAWARKNDIPFFSLRIDLEKESQHSGLGYQEAGRNIRYQWFDSLRTNHSFRFVVTAHHADDRAETVLHRIIRGTGISGLRGIPEKRDAILRPLITYVKEEIVTYAREKHISWREDSSNRSEDYTRNRIRNSVFPLLEKLNPSVKSALLSLAEEAVEVHAVLSNLAEGFWKEHASPSYGAIRIKKFDVHQKGNEAILLCLALRKLGYYPLTSEQVNDLMENLPGKYLQSGHLRLYNDRESLFLVDQRNLSPGTEPIFISELLEGFPEGWTYKFLEGLPTDFNEGLCAYFDLDRLQFPLTLRSWQKGDRIRPFGMDGSMKVSDILIQAKIPLFLKEKQMVLLSQGKVIWVPGYRVAAEVCVGPQTRQILQICRPGM
jgi:tRNA(Ile)-lysidine synthase